MLSLPPVTKPLQQHTSAQLTSPISVLLHKPRISSPPPARPPYRPSRPAGAVVCGPTPGPASASYGARGARHALPPPGGRAAAFLTRNLGRSGAGPGRYRAISLPALPPSSQWGGGGPPPGGRFVPVHTYVTNVYTFQRVDIVKKICYKPDVNMTVWAESRFSSGALYLLP